MQQSTAERITEQQERLAQLEIALAKLERRLRHLRRMYAQEHEHLERLAESAVIAKSEQ